MIRETVTLCTAILASSAMLGRCSANGEVVQKERGNLQTFPFPLQPPPKLHHKPFKRPPPTTSLRSHVSCKLWRRQKSEGEICKNLFHEQICLDFTEHFC